MLPDVSGRHDGSGPDGRPSLARPGGENLVRPEALPLHKPDDPVHVELLSQQGKPGRSDAGGMSGPDATSSVGRSGSDALQSVEPGVGKPGGSDAAKASGGQEGQEKPGLDGRTASQIRNELEKRTGKTFDQLILGLGRGPIDPSKISPRELERELEKNGPLRHREIDTKEPVVIDNVLTPHPTQENRFVSEGRIGPESKIVAEKAAGQQAVRDAFISGVTMGLKGKGSASEGIVKPAPEVRRYEPQPATTHEPRSGPYKPEPPAHGGLGPQPLENNSQLTAPRISTGEIKSQNSTEAARDAALTKWAAQHPGNACVGVVTYDAHGNLSLDIHLAGGNQDLVWHNGNIGHIDPADLPKSPYGESNFGKQIESHVVKYVGEYLGQSFQVKSASMGGPDLVPREFSMRFNLIAK